MILVNKSDNSQEVTLVSGGSITLPPNTTADIGSKVAATPLPHDVEIIQGATTTTVQPTNGVSYPTFPFKGMVVSGLNVGKTEYWDGTAWVELAVAGAATTTAATTTTNSVPSYLRVTKTPLPVGSFVKVDTMPDNRRANALLWDGNKYWSISGITGANTAYNSNAIAYDPVARTYNLHSSPNWLNTGDIVAACVDSSTGTIYFLSHKSQASGSPTGIYKSVNGVVSVVPVPTRNGTLLVKDAGNTGRDLTYGYSNTTNGTILYTGAHPTMWFANNCLYFIRGFSASAASEPFTMYKFDLTNNTANILPIKGQAPALATAQYGNVVQDTNFGYFLGGTIQNTTAGNFTKASGFFKFDFATETWSQIVATGEPAPSIYRGAIVGTDIYYLNYYLDTAVNDRFFKFDTLTNTWNNLTLMINTTLLADTTFAKFAVGVASDGTTIDIFGGAPLATSTGSQYLNTHWQYRPAIGYSGVASRTSVAPTAISTIPNGLGIAPTAYHSGGKIHLTNSTILYARSYDVATDTWGNGNILTRDPTLVRGPCLISESDTHFSYITSVWKLRTVSKVSGVLSESAAGYFTPSFVAQVGDTSYYMTSGVMYKMVASTTKNLSLPTPAVTPTNANPLASSKSLTCSTATTFFLWNNTIGSQTLSEYDTVTNTWTTFPPFVTTPSDVVYSSMLHLNGFIYMVSDTTDELWKYDIAQNAWFNLSGAFLSAGVLPLRRATLTTDGTDIFIVPAETANKTWFRYIP